MLKKREKLSLFLHVMWCQSICMLQIPFTSQKLILWLFFSILVNYFKVTWSRDVRGSRKWRKFLMWAFKLRKTYIFVSTTSALYTSYIDSKLKLSILTQNCPRGHTINRCYCLLLVGVKLRVVVGNLRLFLFFCLRAFVPSPYYILIGILLLDN